MGDTHPFLNQGQKMIMWPSMEYLGIPPFLFLNARPAKIPPKNQEVREANFAKYFPPNPQHFAKFRSRSAFAFLHTTPFLKIVWCTERSPAVLLQQKFCVSHRGASARGER